jgi:hypothetical protein
VCLLCGTCFFNSQYSSGTCVRVTVENFVRRTAGLKSVCIRKILRPAISIQVFLVFPRLQESAKVVPEIPIRNCMLLVRPSSDLNSRKLNVMLCWMCIRMYACNETNLMHCLSAVYSVTIPLHVSGLLSCPSSGGNNVYMQQLVRYVLYVLVNCQLDCLGSHPDQLTFN